jgi:hypothetical protein
MITGSWDKTIKVWDVEVSDEILHVSFVTTAQLLLLLFLPSQETS